MDEAPNRTPTFHSSPTSEEAHIVFNLNLDSFVQRFLEERINDASVRVAKKRKRDTGHKKITSSDPLLQEDCTICMEPFKCNEFKRTLACEHVFHKKCVDKWLKKHEDNKCPLCRR